ncbi:3-oxoacyl-[acyl-carrier-protein] synthase III [Pseudomonas sp. 37 R 15]|uniref:hypothetical protein n=1 Tax=Pseudomonas sp. 37 R 15 TaxID=1844104 RepID=UPI000812698C|nr:hypothetical protein [Pseudomonas sp. 37 R 15]CRM45526.1 3-oxoacyl-[acyl-carrier-protein] synthase III [Pseudomonas sp. 37 R 15]
MQLPEIKHSVSIDELYEQSPVGANLSKVDNLAARWLGLSLAVTWYEFEKKLNATPIVRSINERTITLVEYRDFLINMCYHDGPRWMLRAASNMDEGHEVIRNALIAHVSREHQDFHLLERDYVAVGGDLKNITQYPRNIGYEALSAYVFQQTSTPNPLPAFGVTFIIEGVGRKLTGRWAQNLKQALALTDKQMSNLIYHSCNDAGHYEGFIKMIASPYITPSVAFQIARVAQVASRLYVLQFEEMGSF